MMQLYKSMRFWAWVVVANSGPERPEYLRSFCLGLGLRVFCFKAPKMELLLEGTGLRIDGLLRLWGQSLRSQVDTRPPKQGLPYPKEFPNGGSCAEHGCIRIMRNWCRSWFRLLLAAALANSAEPDSPLADCRTQQPLLFNRVALEAKDWGVAGLAAALLRCRQPYPKINLRSQGQRG